jgi:hypothetical protein
MLTDDARAWLRDLVAMPEADAAAEIAARLLGEREAAYRAGASEMAPAVRDAERDLVAALLRRKEADRRTWPAAERKAFRFLLLSIAANEHRTAPEEGA